jgi:low affinity Fe/Cu permease
MPKKRVVVATKPKLDTAIKKSDSFGRFSTHASTWVGSKWAFLGAVLIIVLWAAVGPLFHFSDTWQLVINTGTTIVTFLMVFLIQNTQNRDARAINLKLDELIHATEGAGNQIIDIESLSDKELDELHTRYEHIRNEWMERGKRRTKSEVSQERSGK